MYLALAAIAAQVPQLDQFRWPGWFLLVVTAIIFVWTLVCFCEEWDDINRQKEQCGIQDRRIPLYVS